MVKRFFVLLTACFMFMFPLAAYADVIMPRRVAPSGVQVVRPNHSFFLRHIDELVPLARSFYANGEGGFVSVKREPGAEEEIFVIENNSVCFISYTYMYKGELWGSVDRVSEGTIISYPYRIMIPRSGSAIITGPDRNIPFGGLPGILGWVPMNQLLPINNVEEISPLEEIVEDAPAIMTAESSGVTRPWNKISHDIYLLIFIVGALVISTAVLIRVFWKPNKKDNKGDS